MTDISEFARLATKWMHTANKVDNAHEEWGGACLYVAKSMRQCAAELLELIAIEPSDPPESGKTWAGIAGQLMAKLTLAEEKIVELEKVNKKLQDRIDDMAVRLCTT